MNIDFAALLGKSPNPYMVMDPELRLVWVNDAYLGATMREREDIIGKTLFDAFPSDPATESYRLLDDSLQRVLRTGQVDELALIRYDITAPDGGMQTHYWSATHTPLLDDAGAVKLILQHTVDVTELQELRQHRKQADLIRRAEKVQSRNVTLVRESRRLTEFFDQAPGFVAVLGGPGHVFEMANTAYLDLVGRRDILGKAVEESLPEVVEQGFIEVLDHVYRSGEPYIGRREKVMLNTADNDAGEIRYLNFIFQPCLNPENEISGIIIQGYDITEEVAFEERQDLLINELQHRVKNTIAVVHALAKQTFRSVPAASSAVEQFSARLSALAAAHGLLTEGSWRPTSLRSLLRATLGASLGDLTGRIGMDGPDHLLDPETALGLTMTVHELATNAVKYGSLSVEDGTVAIDWSVESAGDDDIVHLTWQESGGPPVAEPEHKGFGTRLIERGSHSGGEAEVTMEFRPGGLKCSLAIHVPKDPQSAEHGRPFAKFKKSG
ncbi:sensor histidine kinase [Qipengyuania aestuarii]|uniref:sensor histidine kinase n=1 Tax=Qipengyuania aestuarii TaxID=2867241 RepID=UPI001FFD57A9|nr:PAS domain-containing protein [Qipengyuania aestuarii]